MRKKSRDRKVAVRWANRTVNQMKAINNNYYSLFADEVVWGTSMVHIDEAGQYRRIQPYSNEYWDYRAKMDKMKLDNGEVSNPYHWPTEMLTIDELVDRYGYNLTEEELQKLKDMANEAYNPQEGQ